ncbi:transposon Ty3-I Gag-Pol polyprotein [Trichonephila clavipes]|nr:transposon Ty3-I Gag-Pol polyprotein [Trichonephila clavipes]
MNTTVCDTTGHTPAYLLFGRELRTIDGVVQDFKSVVHNNNFVAEITLYLKRFVTITEDIRERIEAKQDQRKKQYDKNRRPVYYSPGDKLHFEKEADHEKLRPHQHKIHMFQARQLLQQPFLAEPSIPQQKLLQQQLILSPRRDVVGSIGEIVTPPLFRLPILTVERLSLPLADRTILSNGQVSKLPEGTEEGSPRRESEVETLAKSEEFGCRPHLIKARKDEIRRQ